MNHESFLWILLEKLLLVGKIESDKNAKFQNFAIDEIEKFVNPKKKKKNPYVDRKEKISGACSRF